MSTRPLLIAVLATLTLAGSAVAQQRPVRPGGGGEAADSGGVAAIERISETHHTATIGGKQIAYTAHTGTLVLRDDDGKPKASVFFIAYTKDGEDPLKRPVTFFFNGGPGSASIWLDMGIMSPRTPQMGPDGAQPAPPYDLVENPHSPLDATDLVQVDAMMTGYSRPAKGVKVTDFTGDRNDIRMFGEFIRNYLDKYKRWQSPKYLFGESYGTYRSAGLATELQDNEGIELNGIMLLGTVLDFQYLSPSPSNDIGYAAFLPTYTATAWYHKRLPAAMQRLTLEQVVQQARDYAFGDYLVQLARGNKLDQAGRDKVAERLAQLTGVSVDFAKNTNLRIEPGMYRTELLRDSRQMVGRYDSRMIGINGNPASQRQDYDPSDVAPSGAFMSAFMRYLHNDLDYNSPLQYYMGGHTGRWEYPQGRFPTTSESLREAMAKNPYLKVMVGAGYYDMATPFGGAEYTFDHLGFDQTYRDRVQFHYYESGHMAYLNQSSAKQLRDDIAQFINATKAPKPLTQ
jgi:carboxypeptidase C (cathepsin A)